MLRRIVLALAAACLGTGCATGAPNAAGPVAPEHTTAPRGELFEDEDLRTISQNLPAGYDLLPTSPCTRRLCLKSELADGK